MPSGSPSWRRHWRNHAPGVPPKYQRRREAEHLPRGASRPACRQRRRSAAGCRSPRAGSARDPCCGATDGRRREPPSRDPVDRCRSGLRPAHGRLVLLTAQPSGCATALPCERSHSDVRMSWTGPWARRHGSPADSPRNARESSRLTRALRAYAKDSDLQVFLWARLGSNQRLLACEARVHDAFILLNGTICISVRSVRTPCQG